MSDTEQGRYDRDHEVFAPLDDASVLWRYMDFTKLVALLEYRAVHFARADLLSAILSKGHSRRG